jgi:exodeoxyribonuclease-1
MERIQHAAGVVEKIQDVLSISRFPAREDPDEMLYDGGFFSPRDRQMLDRVRGSSPDELRSLQCHFDDPRLPEMVWRFRARNFPETLDSAESERWRAFVVERWRGREGLGDYLRRLAELKARHGDSARDLAILEELVEHAAGLLRSLDRA